MGPRISEVTFEWVPGLVAYHPALFGLIASLVVGGGMVSLRCPAEAKERQPADHVRA